MKTLKKLIEPYGGQLVDLLTPKEELEEMHVRAANLPRLQLTAKNLCDLDQARGGFGGRFSQRKSAIAIARQFQGRRQTHTHV